MLDVDALLRLIAARVSELSDHDLAALEAAIRGGPPPMIIPTQLAEKIADVLTALVDRIDRLEAQLEQVAA